MINYKFAIAIVTVEMLPGKGGGLRARIYYVNAFDGM